MWQKLEDLAKSPDNLLNDCLNAPTEFNCVEPGCEIVGEGFECRFPCDQTEGDFSYTVTVSNSSHSFSVWEESS